MKVLFYILMISLVSSSIFGQTKWSDCLSPTGGTMYATSKYQAVINDKVLSNFTSFQALRFQSGENFWAVEYDTSSRVEQKFFITHLSPSSKIWQSHIEMSEINVKKVRKEINDSDFRLISDLFNEALNSVSASCHNLGIDGSTYTFSNLTSTGKVWSPKSGTKKARLVAICTHISRLLLDKKGEVIKMPKKLKTEILNLTSDFKKFNTEKRYFWN